MAGLRKMPGNNEMVPDNAASRTEPRRRFAHQNTIRINFSMRDQHLVFGNFVATKLRAIDERFLHAVKFQIEQLLIQAARANPDLYFPPNGNALLRNNLCIFDIPPMPLYTPHPANQPFIFPFFTVNHQFIPNIPFSFPFPSVPVIEAPTVIPPMRMLNGPDRRPPISPMAYPQQFPNLIDIPFNENNNFQPPPQQYYNFHVPSGNHGRPKRNGQNADFFNPQRNFGGPRNNNVQQQNNSAGSFRTFRNNSFFSGSAPDESSTTNRQ